MEPAVRVRPIPARVAVTAVRVVTPVMVAMVGRPARWVPVPRWVLVVMAGSVASVVRVRWAPTGRPTAVVTVVVPVMAVAGVMRAVPVVWPAVVALVVSVVWAVMAVRVRPIPARVAVTAVRVVTPVMVAMVGRPARWVPVPRWVLVVMAGSVASVVRVRWAPTGRPTAVVTVVVPVMAVAGVMRAVPVVWPAVVALVVSVVWAVMAVRVRPIPARVAVTAVRVVTPVMVAMVGRPARWVPVPRWVWW